MKHQEAYLLFNMVLKFHLRAGRWPVDVGCNEQQIQNVYRITSAESIWSGAFIHASWQSFMSQRTFQRSTRSFWTTFFTELLVYRITKTMSRLIHDQVNKCTSTLIWARMWKGGQAFRDALSLTNVVGCLPAEWLAINELIMSIPKGDISQGIRQGFTSWIILFY